MRAIVDREAGFTLVELLVSITLFAILTVLLAGSLRTGSRAATAGAARIDRTTELAIAETAIRGQLAGALPVMAPAAAGLNFIGRADGVDFIALPPASLALGGFQRLSLGLAQDRLELHWRPLSDDDDASTTDRRPSLLLDHLDGVAFAYYGARDYAEAPGWRDEWSGAIRLPSLVRLHFQFRDHHAVPDLVVALRLAQADVATGGIA